MRLRLSVMLTLEGLFSVAIAGGGFEVRRQRVFDNSSHICKLFTALLCGVLVVNMTLFSEEEGFCASWGELQLADVHQA
jgi:hypothetical protein